MKKRNIFLTFLSICGVVTVFAFVAANTIRNNNARQSVVSQKGYEYSLPKTENTPVSITENTKEEQKPAEIPVTKPAPEEAKATEETDEIPVYEPEEESYIMPVSGGKIITEYSDSVLVFQPTYNDYRTHLGIDIQADENTPVKSIANGVVTKSETDYEDGYVVEIEYDNGITGVYKNLKETGSAPVGKVVSQGDTIGSVGNSGISESHLPSHLHFSMFEDNAEINPLEKIKE